MSRHDYIYGCDILGAGEQPQQFDPTFLIRAAAEAAESYLKPKQAADQAKAQADLAKAQAEAAAAKAALANAQNQGGGGFVAFMTAKHAGLPTYGWIGGAAVVTVIARMLLRHRRGGR